MCPKVKKSANAGKTNIQTKALPLLENVRFQTGCMKQSGPWEPHISFDLYKLKLYPYRRSQRLHWWTVPRLVSFSKVDFSPRVKMPHNLTKMTRTSEITEWSGWSRKWQFHICMELLSIWKCFWHLKMDSPSRKLYFRKDTWATGIENQGSAVLTDEEVESPNYYQLYVLYKRYQTWREEESLLETKQHNTKDQSVCYLKDRRSCSFASTPFWSVWVWTAWVPPSLGRNHGFLSRTGT